MQHRERRVADAIKEAVAEIILNEMSDPKIGFVTVTRSRVSRDLKNATVYVSIMGNEKVREQGFKHLERARDFIRRRLAQHVKLRYVPELRFALDDVYAHERYVGGILDDLFPKGTDSGAGDVESGETPPAEPS